MKKWYVGNSDTPLSMEQLKEKLRKMLLLTITLSNLKGQTLRVRAWNKHLNLKNLKGQSME